MKTHGVCGPVQLMLASKGTSEAESGLTVICRH